MLFGGTSLTRSGSTLLRVSTVPLLHPSRRRPVSMRARLHECPWQIHKKRAPPESPEPVLQQICRQMGAAGIRPLDQVALLRCFGDEALLTAKSRSIRAQYSGTYS